MASRFEDGTIMHPLVGRKVRESQMMRKRIVKAQMVKRGKEEEKFDCEFWREIGHEGRFVASWEMISEVESMRGKSAGQSRLQRSVQSIQRQVS